MESSGAVASAERRTGHPAARASRYAWLSIAAALVTIALKVGAYLLTGSVALLSDALESFVNLAGALMALAMLTVAARPADDGHAWGHGKAEYFSSGVEGALIVLAAAGISVTAVSRLLHPRGLEHVAVGIGVSIVASVVNLLVSIVLLKASREHHSITLEADAKHLQTDVFTSAGVVVGVAAVALTGWSPLDPICALLVAANIVKTGYGVVRESVHGLMDAAIPAGELAAIEKALAPHLGDGIQVHALKTRRAGARKFVTMHVLVPGAWTVQRGHDLCEAMEAAIREAVPFSHVTTHLEPVEDPVSWEDQDLDRG